MSKSSLRLAVELSSLYPLTVMDEVSSSFDDSDHVRKSYHTFHVKFTVNTEMYIAHLLYAKTFMVPFCATVKWN